MNELTPWIIFMMNKLSKNNLWRNLFFKIFCLLFIPSTVISLEALNCECSPSVVQVLASIDSREKDILKFFFQSLFASGDFAYTLFGNKPMALMDHNLEFAFFEQNKGKLRRKAILELQGWEIWKKHAHRFSITQFYFINKKTKSGFNGALICKKSSQKLINKHSELFKNISEPSTVIETITDRMNNLENDVEFPEHYFQCLGILLGYGHNNAKAYEQDSSNRNLLAAGPFDLKKYSSQETENLINQTNLNIRNVHLPSKVYSPNIKDLLHQLSSHRQSYGPIKATHKINPLCPIRTPGFMAVSNNPETEEIINDYDSLREKLVKIYHSDKFLEIILTRLTSTE